MVKKAFFNRFPLIACIFLACTCVSMAETLIYKVTIRLFVPRVYNNMESLGYRKPQWQKITGYMSVDKSDVTGDCSGAPGEPSVWSWGFTNNTHKVSGKKVSYADCAVGTDIMWRYIGDNKTGVFKRPCMRINLDLDPSYNIGDDEPDNTLVIVMSGTGPSDNVIRGSVTGQIGCGCGAYGHISPTRDILGNVSDITPLYGCFTMRLKSRSP